VAGREKRGRNFCFVCLPRAAPADRSVVVVLWGWTVVLLSIPTKKMRLEGGRRCGWFLWEFSAAMGVTDETKKKGGGRIQAAEVMAKELQKPATLLLIQPTRL
jgi:hypothetical protein